MKLKKIKKNIAQYYSSKFSSYGASPQGVDWNSNESQCVRFDQLLKVCDDAKFLINDLGCGHGALYDYMTKKGYRFEYFGYDVAHIMIDYAKKRYEVNGNCRFIVDDNLHNADYSVASGIFNVKFSSNINEWREYIKETLNLMNVASSKGFAFNMLTKYSDEEYMKNNLYYADPCFYFDYCKKHFSKNIALLHDYGLHEFTVLVKKE